MAVRVTYQKRSIFHWKHLPHAYEQARAQLWRRGDVAQAALQDTGKR